ncbi:MAG: aspartate/glutamate racemase family protein [Betaproteobacteria bacterium]
MIDAAIRLERGGADFVLMCTNTMHRMAGAVSEAINIPLLHIADPTGEKIRRQGLEKSVCSAQHLRWARFLQSALERPTWPRSRFHPMSVLSPRRTFDGGN